MNAQDLQNIFEKLNKDLYVDSANTTYNLNTDLGSCGVYLKNVNENLDKSRGNNYEYRQISGRTMRYLGYVPVKHIPYTNEYDEKGRIVAVGLREWAKKLQHLQLAPESKISRLLNVGMVGRGDWDYLNDFEKEALKKNQALKQPLKLEEHINAL